MGSQIYTFLADSILFNDNQINKKYSELSENQLEKLLQEYREFCLKNYEELKKDVIKTKSSLKVFSHSEKISLKTIKQCALYLDNFIIDDPLFKNTHVQSNVSKNFSKYLGDTNKGIDRNSIANACRLLKNVTPMVVGNYLKVLPASHSFEPPSQIPLKLPPVYPNDPLLKKIFDFCWNNMEIKSMQKFDNNWHVLDKLNLEPGISISFKDFDRDKTFIAIYHIMEKANINEDEKGHMLETAMTIAKYPMDIDVWCNWSCQSAINACKEVIERIFLELTIARNLDATYLSDNRFTADLFNQSFYSSPNIQNFTLNQFLNLELPFNDNINLEKLMEVRESEEEVFTNFRLELDRNFRELRTIKDEKELKIRQDNILHELSEVQVRKINKKFKNLRLKGVFETSALIGGLALSVQTGGISLLASFIAGFTGFKTYSDYKEQLTENPSYLLWKVLKKSS